MLVIGTLNVIRNKNSNSTKNNTILVCCTGSCVHFLGRLLPIALYSSRSYFSKPALNCAIPIPRGGRIGVPQRSSPLIFGLLRDHERSWGSILSFPLTVSSSLQGRPAELCDCALINLKIKRTESLSCPYFSTKSHSQHIILFKTKNKQRALAARDTAGYHGIPQERKQGTTQVQLLKKKCNSLP